MSENIFCLFCDNTNIKLDYILENVQINLQYLQDLLRDQKILLSLGDIVSQVTMKLLKREIMVARHQLFHRTELESKADDFDDSNSSPRNELVAITEKIYVPVHLNPKYNFVGRIIGPSGSSIRLLEKKFNCKIHVRGRGSVRSQKTNDDEDLHVVVTIDNIEEKLAHQKLEHVKCYFHNLFQESVNKTIAEDEEKQNQLLEYAIVKGTYREMDFKSQQNSVCVNTRKRKASPVSCVSSCSTSPSPTTAALRANPTSTHFLSLLPAKSQPVANDQIFSSSTSISSTNQSNMGLSTSNLIDSLFSLPPQNPNYLSNQHVIQQPSRLYICPSIQYSPPNYSGAFLCPPPMCNNSMLGNGSSASSLAPSLGIIDIGDFSSITGVHNTGLFGLK